MNDIIYVGKHLVTYNVSRHDHGDWEIIYCTNGNGEFVIADGDTIRYSKGDIIVIPPQTVHTNKSKDGFTNIHINLRNATLSFKYPIRITDDTERHILSCFDASFFYFNSQFEKKDLLLSGLSNLLINYIIAFRSNKQLSRIVETIKNDIIVNFPNCNYQLDEYMRSLPFSYDYLRKLFKSEIGITPHNFLTNMRMQTADKLLCSMHESEYNISKISALCGFDEPLYFSRVFKKEYGCSPINFAKKMSSRAVAPLKENTDLPYTP